MNELSDPAAPPVVQSWVQSIPDWLEVKAPHSAPDEALQVLDPGERQAIQLAQEQGADLLLIDERRGSVAARRLGFDNNWYDWGPAGSRRTWPDQV
jgi:predicted nucleic acid-binding protein